MDTFLRQPATESNIPTEQTDLGAQINDAAHHEEIFDVLDRAGYHQIATRLRYLHELPKDDDPDYLDPDMDLTSLRRFSAFFMSDDVSFPDPRIGVSHDGFLQAEWYSPNAAALLDFMPNGDIVFAATMEVNGHRESQDIHGTAGKELALQVIWPFINHH